MGTKRPLSCVDGSSKSGSPPPQAASDLVEEVASERPTDETSVEPRSKRPRIEDLLFGPPAATSISDLPDALIAELLRAVSSRQEPGKGYSAALVSKRWLRLSPETQQSVRVRESALLQSDSLFSQILSFTSLTSLELSFCSIDRLDDEFIARVGTAWPGLTSFSVHEMAAFLRCEVTQAGLDTLFSQCRGLRHLSLQQQSVTPLKMPASFGRLQELQTLRLGNKHSSLMTSPLPDNLGELRNLTHLHIQSQGLESLPASLGALSRLTCLQVESRGIRYLPSEIGNLSSLVALQLQCSSLHRLPDTIEGLKRLKRIHVASANMQEIPSTLGALSQLTRLDISNCYRLHALPKSLEHLTALRFLGIGPGLQSYKSFSPFRFHLKNLHISNFRGRKLPPLGVLKQVEALSISFCDALTTLPDCIGSLTRLAKLTIKQCPLLRELPAAVRKIPVVSTDGDGCIRCTE